jgi:hypothetical protein
MSDEPNGLVQRKGGPARAQDSVMAFDAGKQHPKFRSTAFAMDEGQKPMSIHTLTTFATALVFAAATAAPAGAHFVRRHHNRLAVEQPEPPSNNYGGRLVMHPASNIACIDRDAGTRAVPCDQPIWVYGSPCEVDLGLGRSRPCDGY